MLEIYPDFAVARARLETSLKCWSLQQNMEAWQLWLYIVTSTLLRDYTGVRTGFANVMEIDNAIFQDPKDSGKRDIFRSGYGRVLDLCV